MVVHFSRNCAPSETPSPRERKLQIRRKYITDNMTSVPAVGGAGASASSGIGDVAAPSSDVSEAVADLFAAGSAAGTRVYRAKDFRTSWKNLPAASAAPASGDGPKRHVRHMLDLQLVAVAATILGWNEKDVAAARVVFNDARINKDPVDSKAANVGAKGGDGGRACSVSDLSAVNKVLGHFFHGKPAELTANEASHFFKAYAVLDHPDVRKALGEEKVLQMKCLLTVVMVEGVTVAESEKFNPGELDDARRMGSYPAYKRSAVRSLAARYRARVRAATHTALPKTAATPTAAAGSDSGEPAGAPAARTAVASAKPPAATATVSAAAAAPAPAVVAPAAAVAVAGRGPAALGASAAPVVVPPPHELQAAFDDVRYARAAVHRAVAARDKALELVNYEAAVRTLALLVPADVSEALMQQARTIAEIRERALAAAAAEDGFDARPHTTAPATPSAVAYAPRYAAVHSAPAHCFVAAPASAVALGTTSARGHALYQGPRGGVFHMSSGGHRVYH